MKQELNQTIEIPEGCTVTYQKRMMTAKGDNGEVSRQIFHPTMTIEVKGKEVVFDAPVATQREKRQMFSLVAHVKNMIRGSTKGHSYRLKVCSGHFPMNVSISNNVFTVKNFLGEAVPRTTKVKEGVTVKVNGDIIEVTSSNIELAGSQASDIEQLTRITNRDRRIFQDGLFIIEKDGVQL
jgi:large subunit ribosomal protein L6